MIATDSRPSPGLARRMLRWTREAGHFATLGVGSATKRVGRLYDGVVGTSNLVGEESLYLNFGYWKNRPATVDEACNEMARLVGSEAGITTGDVVIDVGCGFGDQDFLWHSEFSPAQIIGVNVAPSQIQVANRRAAERGIDENVRFVMGSADDIPRENESATKVLALESAFHFPSRTDFFDEAFRVLKPGGRLVTADVIPLPRHEVTGRTRNVPAFGAYARLVWFSTGKKRMSATDYREALQRSGFSDVKLYSIREHVFPPFMEFVGSRLRDGELKHVNPLGRAWFSPIAMSAWSPWLDYVIAVADKPAS